MSENYSLREVHVTLQPNVVLIAEVDSIAAIKKLLKDLQSAQFETKAIDIKLDQGSSGQKASDDSPESRMESKSRLSLGSLKKANLIAFKDNVPELLLPGNLSVTDAVLILLFAVETGLKKQKIEYEAFKALYESQNIKSGSPLSVKLTDLRNEGYVDKKLYAEQQSLRLTAKGEGKAIEVIKKLASGSTSS
jgi:hypothetical protein